ncbi:MAG: hypothetical protein AAGC60_29550 [Acidobacteriota bacterium]
MPRYPDINVRLHSRNPLALVSAVRAEMRLHHVDPVEIQRFTSQAMSADDPREVRDVCAQWARVALV